jgi:transcriptional regulator with XRE-family HTH domain
LGKILNIGERIKKLRQENNLSIQKLAEKSGISSAAIYKIEVNSMTPSVTTLLKIAKALDKGISFFVEDEDKVKDVEFVKKQERRKLSSSEAKFKVEVIAERLQDCKIYAGILTVYPGGKSGDELLSHTGEELVLCLDGEVEFKIGDKKYLLCEGDSLHYKPEIPHSWKNVGKRKAKLLYILTPPPHSSEISIVE